MRNDRKAELIAGTEAQEYMAGVLRSGRTLDLDFADFADPAELELRFNNLCLPSRQFRTEVQQAWARWITERMGISEYQDDPASAAVVRDPGLLFGTYTYKDFRGSPPGVQRVRRTAAAYIRKIERLVQSGVVVVERGERYNRRHLHAIYRPKPGIYLGAVAARLCSMWTSGFVRLEAASSQQHVINYVSKYMCKSGLESPEDDFWVLQD